MHRDRQQWNTRAAWPILGWTMIVVISFAGLIWLSDLEQRLPEVRATGDDSSSTLIPELELTPPGEHVVSQMDYRTEGEWFWQDIGDEQWLVSVQPGAVMEVAFFGSSISITARQGPDADQVYVLVDESPVNSYPSDEFGSIVNLFGIQANAQEFTIADNLAHGEHKLRLVNGEETELAIHSFSIAAETPFPWAFQSAYALMTGLILIGVRNALILSISYLGWRSTTTMATL